MNITLIGMTGVGKSSIGRQLALILKYSFIDPDEIIKKDTGLGLQQIIEQKGEQAFLELEEQAIIRLGQIDNCVICPGGSAVYSPRAMDFLEKCSVVVFLRSGLAQIKQRLNDMEKRGVIGLGRYSLEELYAQRVLLYEKYSRITVDLSAEQSIEEQARHIADIVLKQN